jgi:hypothetical protein
MDAVNDRVRFTIYKGKQILLVDLASCPAFHVEKTMRALPDLVTTLPRNSVLILSDFTGASFDEEAVRAMEQAAVFDKPFIKKAAWVGTKSLPDVFSDRVKSFSRREFSVFQTHSEAMDWLVKD